MHFSIFDISWFLDKSRSDLRPFSRIWTRHFGEINHVFWIDATFSVPKNKTVQKRCFWEEHTHFLLSKTPKLFDNGQLLVILEGFFGMSLWFLHLHACYCLICPMYQATTTNDKAMMTDFTRSHVKIIDQI